MKVKGDKMKNTKIFVILSGITALLFGVAAKNTTAFQAKLAQSIRVDTVLFCADTETIIPPSKGKNG